METIIWIEPDSGTTFKSALGLSEELDVGYTRIIRILRTLNCPRHRGFYMVDDDMQQDVEAFIIREDTPCNTS